MPIKALRDYLDRNGVKYVTIRHSPAYTSQEIAASAHVKGQNLAKTVIVKIDESMTMAVLPARYRVDIDSLREAASVRAVALATETEFVEMFPACEAGAMPPFGNLYDMKVYVDTTLTQDRVIAFNAGSHSELIQLEYADFRRLVEPVVLSFSR